MMMALGPGGAWVSSGWEVCDSQLFLPDNGSIVLANTSGVGSSIVVAHFYECWLVPEKYMASMWLYALTTELGIGVTESDRGI